MEAAIGAGERLLAEKTMTKKTDYAIFPEPNKSLATRRISALLTVRSRSGQVYAFFQELMLSK